MTSSSGSEVAAAVCSAPLDFLSHHNLSASNDPLQQQHQHLHLHQQYHYHHHHHQLQLDSSPNGVSPSLVHLAQQDPLALPYVTTSSSGKA